MLPNDETKKRFILNVLFLLALGLVLFVGFKFFPVFAPFIFGWIIALIIDPAVVLLKNKLKINRKIGGAICVVLFVLLVGTLFYFLISLLMNELRGLVSLIPVVGEQIPQAIEELEQNFIGFASSFPPETATQINEILNSILAGLVNIPATIVRQLLTALMTAAAGLPGIALSFVITIVSACFISMDYPTIRGFFLDQLNKRFRSLAIDAKGFAVTSVFKLLRAYLILMFITFVELAVGFTLIGIPYATTIALLVSFVDILPVLGTGTILIPWGIIAFLMHNPYQGLCIFVLYALITVIRYILEPKIVGSHIGLHPLVTLIAIFAGLKLCGLIGLVLFPVAIIILKNFQDAGKLKIWNPGFRKPNTGEKK